MAKKPSKPTNVDVEKLQAVVDTLEKLQGELAQPRPGTWTDVQGSLESDLKQGDGNDATGIQGDLAIGVGQAYEDNVYWIGQSRTKISGGVTALVGMMKTTIALHGKSDSNVSESARSTNTTQSTSAHTRGA